MNTRSVGFVCPSPRCGSTNEQSYYGVVIVDDKAVGHRLRCRDCSYSWIAPYWGEGELIVDYPTGKYILIERSNNEY